MIHSEAYCLMTYRLVPPNPTAAIRPAGTPDPNAPQTLTVWNPRDGVTPFILGRHGCEYMHDIQAMQIAPGHAGKLVPGDLVWVSVTPESAAEYALSAEMQAAYATDMAHARAEGSTWWIELYPTYAHWAVARALAMYGRGDEPDLKEVDQTWIDDYLRPWMRA